MFVLIMFNFLCFQYFFAPLKGNTMGRSKKYHNETERQEAKKLRERERRANETNDERLERLKKLSLNAQKRRAEETADERKQRLRRLSQNELKRRAKETEEEKYERLKKLAQYARNRRATGSKNYNTRQSKKDQEEKQSANGYIKVNLLKYYDVQEFHHQEQMQDDTGICPSVLLFHLSVISRLISAHI